MDMNPDDDNSNTAAVASWTNSESVTSTTSLGPRSNRVSTLSSEEKPIIPARSPLRPPARTKSLTGSLRSNLGLPPRVRTSFAESNRDSRSTDSPGTTPRTPVTPIDRLDIPKDRDRDSFPSLDDLLAASVTLSAVHGLPHPFPQSRMLSASDDSSATIIVPPESNSAEYNSLSAMSKALPSRPDSPPSDGVGEDHLGADDRRPLVGQGETRRRPLARRADSIKHKITSTSTTSASPNNASPTSAPSPAVPEAVPAPVPGPVMTKRQYALHELLSSERAYASDLVLIRDIHVPLALGEYSIIFPEISFFLFVVFMGGIVAPYHLLHKYHRSLIQGFSRKHVLPSVIAVSASRLCSLRSALYLCIHSLASTLFITLMTSPNPCP